MRVALAIMKTLSIDEAPRKVNCQQYQGIQMISFKYNFKIADKRHSLIMSILYLFKLTLLHSWAQVEERFREIRSKEYI